MFGLFRSKLKQCTVCGNETPGLHEVYSGLAYGEKTDGLCSDCLMRKLKDAITAKRILFIEPATTDGYTFSPGTESTLLKERVQLALNAHKPCSTCAEAAPYVWMLQDDLDEQAMEQQPDSGYYLIPLAPQDWKHSSHFCKKHMIDALRKMIDAKRFYFLTFRFPDDSSSGYYS